MKNDELLHILKPMLINFKQQLENGYIDPATAHVFWLYPIMRTPKFIKALSETINNIPKARVKRIGEFEFYPGWCRCGYQGTMISHNSVVSESYGRYVSGFCPASLLTHMFLSRLNLIAIVLNRRIEIHGMKNIYPKYIKSSFLVKNDKNLKISMVMDVLKNIDEMKLIAYSPRYLSFMATDTIQASMKNVIYTPDRILLF